MGSFQIWALSWMIVILVGLSPMLGVVVIRFLANLLRRKAGSPRNSSASADTPQERQPDHTPRPQ